MQSNVHFVSTSNAKSIHNNPIHLIEQDITNLIRRTQNMIDNGSIRNYYRCTFCDRVYQRNNEEDNKYTTCMGAYHQVRQSRCSLQKANGADIIKDIVIKKQLTERYK
jgi:hypothetical protein